MTTTPVHEDHAPDIAELAQLAKHIAQEAGRYIRDNQPDQVTVAATKSTPTDVVTQMDRDVEALIRDTLARKRPQDGFFGEEGARLTDASGLTWVVDPVDGTVNYLYGLDSYAVSVAVVERGPDPLHWRVLAGAVHDVIHRRTFWAGLSLGAWRDSTRLRLPSAPPLAECLVGTGFGYSVQRRTRQAQVLTTVLPRIRDIRRIGSAALDLCRVASGQLDLYYERGLEPWDHAAGGLIVSEAGGVVTGLRGAFADVEMLVAGSQEPVSGLVELLELADADSDV